MTKDDESKRVAEVLRLSLVEGLGIRAIARRTSTSRKRVREILGRAYSPKQRKPAEPRVSILAPYDATLRKILEDAAEIHAPAMLERLRALGYTGGITIVRDRLRVLRPRPRGEAFLELDFKPGAALQVDWADFGFALPGCPRRVSAFIAALAYSRLLYLEFTLSQKMGAFLRCMDRALDFYQGVTLTDIFDNMKTVVRERSGTTVVFNPRFVEYARVRGFAIAACNPRRGNEKGRVERPVGFVRTRFWPGRRFRDLFDLNVQATAWRDDFANSRVHEVTGKIPSLVFKHDEKPLLKPLQHQPFETDDIECSPVTKTSRVTFDRNRYSVPWRLFSQRVVVRANDESVSAWLGPKEVARHARSWGVGETITHPSHEEGLRERKPRANANALPPGLLGLEDIGRQYFKLLAANSRSIHREVLRLIFLVEIFGESATRDAMAEVMKTGHVGAEYVEHVMRHKKRLVPAPAPIRLGDPDLDNLSFREPDLSAYDVLSPPARTLDPGSTSEQAEPLNETGGST